MTSGVRVLSSHLILVIFLVMSIFPFAVISLNTFRTTPEIQRSSLGVPAQLGTLINNIKGAKGTDSQGRQQSFADTWYELTAGYKRAWKYMRDYTVNTLFVALVTGIGTVLAASLCAYVLARFHFPGSRFLYLLVISMMMIPGVLTLIPSFLLVKDLGLLNSYLALILPYIAGGQIMAIFLMKGFFEDLPKDMFDAGEIDGAGHLRLYWHVVLPLSQPIVYLIFALSILGVWNNFLWPFVVNSNPKYHVIPSGIYLLSREMGGQGDLQSIYSAYVLSAIPMLVLFILATRAFLRGITAGAFKA